VAIPRRLFVTSLALGAFACTERLPMPTEPPPPTMPVDGFAESNLWGPGSPAMRVVMPADRRSPVPALIVFRGGGYAMNHGSGAGAAAWAAAHGMVGVEVPYRTQESGDAFPKNFADAARAVRLVRSRAAILGVDSKRVGVLGFSAGGHLAALVSTQPDLYRDPADDLAATTSARPDFVVLGYPVVSFVARWSPGSLSSSAENFLGDAPLDEATRARFSNELHVAPGHPPVFVWTTADDGLVPAAHARAFAAACERAGVPVHLEVFRHGPHGMGLALDAHSDVRTWTPHLLEWLDERAILPRR
jgi:acetyl esterase/lipase